MRTLLSTTAVAVAANPVDEKMMGSNGDLNTDW